MKTYITFGQIHVHSVSGKTFDKDCVAVIETPDAESGRAKAFEIFDGVFHEAYTETEFNENRGEIMQWFPRGLIEV